MKAGDFRSRGVVAVVAASVASSVLAFAILLIINAVSPAGSNDWLGDPTDIAVVLAVVMIWAPAFALIPAAILGVLVERPKARMMIERRSGGLALHLLLSVAAAALLWLLFRIVLLFTHSTPQLMDALSLALFALIGVCSGISWWFLVVLPGQRE